MVVFLAVGVSAVSARVLSCLAVSSSSSQRKRKPEEEVSFYRVLQNAWPTAGASFLSRCFFFGLFFLVFSSSFVYFCGRRTRAAKEDSKTFVVSIYSFLFIYFFIVLSPQITQKEKIALVLISLHFFFTRGDDDDDDDARFFTPGSGC